MERGFAMRPRERRETSEQDLFRSRLDQIIDMKHVLVFDRSSLTRWRQRMGEEKLQALLQESLAVATRTNAMKPSDLARVVIDTTVQPKAVMFPTDAKLLNRARERLVRLAKKLGVSLRQSYRRVGKLAPIKHQRYAHAHQFKRANRSLRKPQTYLGRVLRHLARVKFLSRLFTALNLLPSIATLASVNSPILRQSATNRAQTCRIARPLSLRKSAIVL